MGVISRPTHQIFADIKVQTPMRPEPRNHLAHLAHHLRSNSIPRQNQQRRLCHNAVFLFGLFQALRLAIVTVRVKKLADKTL